MRMTSTAESSRSMKCCIRLAGAPIPLISRSGTRDGSPGEMCTNRRRVPAQWTSVRTADDRRPRDAGAVVRGFESVAEARRATAETIRDFAAPAVRVRPAARRAPPASVRDFAVVRARPGVGRRPVVAIPMSVPPARSDPGSGPHPRLMPLGRPSSAKPL